MAAISFDEGILIDLPDLLILVPDLDELDQILVIGRDAVVDELANLSRLVVLVNDVHNRWFLIVSTSSQHFG